MPKLPVLEIVPTAQVCCAPLTASPLSVEDAAELSMRLKALADPARLRLVSLLLSSENGEMCTCDVTEPLGLSQPTISHHFKAHRGRAGHRRAARNLDVVPGGPRGTGRPGRRHLAGYLRSSVLTHDSRTGTIHQPPRQ